MSEYFQKLLCPKVVLVSSEDVVDICKRNGLQGGLETLLQPFSASIERVPLRTSTFQQITIPTFHLNIVKEVELGDDTVLEKAASYLGSPDGQWYERFRDALLLPESRPMVEYETFDTPIACTFLY